jgi:hypothetical protein
VAVREYLAPLFASVALMPGFEQRSLTFYESLVASTSWICTACPHVNALY